MFFLQNMLPFQKYCVLQSECISVQCPLRFWKGLVCTLIATTDSKGVHPFHRMLRPLYLCVQQIHPSIRFTSRREGCIFPKIHAAFLTGISCFEVPVRLFKMPCVMQGYFETYYLLLFPSKNIVLQSGYIYNVCIYIYILCVYIYMCVCMCVYYIYM